MSNNKQSSSIDWIIKQLIFKTEFENLPNQYVLMSDKDIDSIIEQAKAMHKEEIMQTYSDGLGNGMHFERGDGNGKDLDEEQYYKDTFA